MFRIAHILPLGVFLGLGAATLVGARVDPGQIQSWLDHYLGSWKGELRIETADGREITRMPVAAEYWRSGKDVFALTAFEMEDGMTFVKARMFLRNGLLFSEVTQEEMTVLYRGYLRGEEMFWIPYDAELNTERRMKEWFSEEDGGTILVIEGLERLRSDKGQAHVRLEARLKKD